MPVSHVIVGETKTPINPSSVKIYLDYPKEYEKIALIDAGSNFAFKDPSCPCIKVCGPLLYESASITSPGT